MAKNDAIKISKQVTEEIFDMLGIKSKIEATLEEPVKGDAPEGEEQDFKYIKIHISGDELGAVIGFRGRNLVSLQYILGLVIKRKLGEDNKYRILLDVNDYRESHEGRVRNIAEAYIRDLREKGGEIELHPMKPDERRIIHMYVQEQDDVISESVGEGRDRRVKIKLKS